MAHKDRSGDRQNRGSILSYALLFIAARFVGFGSHPRSALGYQRHPKRYPRRLPAWQGFPISLRIHLSGGQPTGILDRRQRQRGHTER